MKNLRASALGRVIALALPAILENVMFTLVNIVDTIMVGSLGPAATAATALNAPPAWLARSISMSIAGGATVLVARHWGAGDYEAAGRCSRQALTLSLILGAALTLTAQLITPHYPLWMRAETPVVADAAAYMSITGGAQVFTVVSFVLYGVLRGSGDTVTPMIVSSLTNLMNVIGNFLLIYPSRTLDAFGGIPLWGAGLGVRGAAISTALSVGMAGVAMLFILARRTDALKIRWGQSFRLCRSQSGAILKVGLPIAGERVAISGGQVLFMSIVSGLGTISVAGHYLATTAEGICYNPAFGFSAAATTLTGQALGAGDEKTAQTYGRICINLCAAVMTVVSVAMYLFAPQMIGLFSDNAQVIAQGAMALRIVSFAEPLFGVSLAATGALRGAGDTMIPLWTGIVCMLGLRMASAVFFVQVLQIGLAGAWYAMDIDTGLRGIILWGYFCTGRWKKRSRELARAPS